MKREQAIFLIFALFFIVVFAIAKSWAPLIGALFCLSIYAFFVSIDRLYKSPSLNENVSRGTTALKSEIDKQNQIISELTDRIGRAELATALRPGSGSVADMGKK